MGGEKLGQKPAQSPGKHFPCRSKLCHCSFPKLSLLDTEVACVCVCVCAHAQGMHLQSIAESTHKTKHRSHLLLIFNSPGHEISKRIHSFKEHVKFLRVSCHGGYFSQQTQKARLLSRGVGDLFLTFRANTLFPSRLGTLMVQMENQRF